MTQSMQGKVAAVTGAASGIGLECARILLEQGATVVLTGRTREKLEKVAARMRSDAAVTREVCRSPDQAASRETAAARSRKRAWRG